MNATSSRKLIPYALKEILGINKIHVQQKGIQTGVLI